MDNERVVRILKHVKEAVDAEHGDLVDELTVAASLIVHVSLSSEGSVLALAEAVQVIAIEMATGIEAMLANRGRT